MLFDGLCMNYELKKLHCMKIERPWEGISDISLGIDGMDPLYLEKEPDSFIRIGHFAQLRSHMQLPTTMT